MSYPWNNEEKLLTLRVSGESDVLTLETGREEAKVYLADGDIDRLVCNISGTSTVINPAQAHHIVVGAGTAQRDVYHYLKPNGPAPFLRVGITKHRGYGTWSSLPHSFELNTELGFEEVFFYLLKGGSGRAIQVGKGVWCDGAPVDKAWFVSDHSWSTIPMGYHPVVGEPEVHVTYIWAYLSKKKHWEKI
jgi:5-deoxy-D-glucuronate isomerase